MSMFSQLSSDIKGFLWASSCSVSQNLKLESTDGSDRMKVMSKKSTQRLLHAVNVDRTSLVFFFYHFNTGLIETWSCLAFHDCTTIV